MAEAEFSPSDAGTHQEAIKNKSKQKEEGEVKVNAMKTLQQSQVLAITLEPFE